MSKKFILKKWSGMKNLKDKFFSMICFASRRSGKSELVKYIYQKLNFGEEYDHVIVISECNDTIDFFSEFVHGNLFIREFDGEVVSNTILVSRNNEAEGTKLKFLVIIDDVVGNTIKHSEWMSKLYATGRHDNISCILICQKLTLINTTVRNNSDVIFIGQAKSGNERDSIIKNMLHGVATRQQIRDLAYSSKDEFYEDLLIQNTTNHNFIVLDYISTTSNDFDDVVYSIKAKILK